MMKTAARAGFNFSKRYFNQVDQFLAEWEHKLTRQEFNLRPATSRLRLPSLPAEIDPKSSHDELLAYDQAAFADSRLQVRVRFWSLGIRRWLIGCFRRGLFRIRVLGSQLYFKLIER